MLELPTPAIAAKHPIAPRFRLYPSKGDRRGNGDWAFSAGCLNASDFAAPPPASGWRRWADRSAMRGGAPTASP